MGFIRNGEYEGVWGVWGVISAISLKESRALYF